MESPERKLIGEYLVEWGKIQPEDVQQALDAQSTMRPQKERMLIGEILINMGVVDRQDILAALAQQEFAVMGLTKRS